jgi:cupin fold WbuC family metalloprotein
MEMIYHQESPEVLYSKDELSTVNSAEIDALKARSLENDRKRVRLCTHSDSNDVLHEMLIVHRKNTYVRPHKHPGKTESTHIIEGLVDIVLFDDEGKVDRVLNMGDYASGRIFYYRMATPMFHTLIIRSDILVFHETTNGPFNRDATRFAPWAPEESETTVVFDFMSDLNKRLSLI